MSSFAEQVPVPLPPSFFELETSDSESDADLQSFGRAFEGLVIAVSGKLPGETHCEWLITSCLVNETELLDI